jgi:hypothetical protein
VDRRFDNGLRFVNADDIAVFIIDGASLGRTETAFVPEGARCIFINGASLDSLFESFFLTGAAAMQKHNSFDKAMALALIFVHELGHLHFGDSGSYGPPAALDLRDIDKPSEAIANREVRADKFAAEILARAWNSHERRSPIGTLYGRASIANNIFRILATGSNTFDFRNDPQGVLDHIAKPQLFRQAGYSHLNLYVRLLVLLEQLNPDEDRRRQLQWISSSFTRGAPQAR